MSRAAPARDRCGVPTEPKHLYYRTNILRYRYGAEAFSILARGRRGGALLLYFWRTPVYCFLGQRGRSSATGGNFPRLHEHHQVRVVRRSGHPSTTANRPLPIERSPAALPTAPEITG